MEHFKLDVNNWSMKVGGLQQIKTIDGYSFPIDIINGLPYTPMCPFTNSKFEPFFRKIIQKWQCCIDQFINVHYAKQFSTIKNKQTSRNTFTNTSRTVQLFVIIV